MVIALELLSDAKSVFLSNNWGFTEQIFGREQD